MTLQEILSEKGAEVFTTHPNATLAEVVDELVRRGVGSLVVCASPDGAPCDMVGIVTERDILRTYAKTRDLSSLKVSEVMSRDIIAGARGDSVERAMGLMTDNRIRHLPVVENGRLVGMISIGDLVKGQLRQFAVENHYLKSYIHS